MEVNGYTLNWKKRLRITGESFAAAPAQFVPRLPRRRFQAFCVGTPRSGTHSVASMLEASFRSGHEPGLHDTIVHMLAWSQGQQSDRQFGRLLRARDKFLNLEMDSSHFLHHIAGLLVEIFPDAKFVLPVRDPVSWLNSEVNQNLHTAKTPWWTALENFRYGKGPYSFSEHDSYLATLPNVRPVTTYLSYWRKHNESILDTVPAEKLWICRTSDLRKRIPDLAEFLGIDPDLVDQRSSHTGLMGKPVNIYDHIDRDYVQKESVRICGPLMKRFGLVTPE